MPQPFEQNGPAGPPHDPELTAPAYDKDELRPGERAGEYVVRSKLARGGCGTVYVAEHELLSRRAAVKVLHGHMAGSPQMVERFLREARSANLIRHPSIVDVFEFGALEDGRPYFVMELLEGDDLERLLRRQGRVSPAEALEILEPVCAALAAAHAVGIVHRDLKASNVVVIGPSGRRTVKLLDFGIAKLVDPDPAAPQLTSVGRRLGTPVAMAPEQIRAEPVDARTDVYGLGVLAFQLVTGRYPFLSADPLELERMHLDTPPPRPSDFGRVPQAVEGVILRCLEKSMVARYPSVTAFLDELRGAIARREVPSSRSGTPSAPRAAPRLAMAVYVEALLDPEAEIDDATFDRLAVTVEAAESALREAGMSLAIQTASSVLGIAPLPEDDDGARRRQILDAATRLHAELTAGALPIAVSVHCDHAVVRETARGLEVVSGPLLRLGTWGTREPGALSVSEAALG